MKRMDGHSTGTMSSSCFRAWNPAPAAITSYRKTREMFREYKDIHKRPGQGGSLISANRCIGHAGPFRVGRLSKFLMAISRSLLFYPPMLSNHIKRRKHPYRESQYV